jgi:hypothetical protein
LNEEGSQHLALLLVTHQHHGGLRAVSRRPRAQPRDEGLQGGDLRLGLQHLASLHILEGEDDSKIGTYGTGTLQGDIKFA